MAQLGLDRPLVPRLVAAVIAGVTLLGPTGCDYYRNFNLALGAIERSGCAESIEYSRHEDLTLEEFNFKIRTQSGRLVRVWFDDDMKVEEACSRPVGLLVFTQRGREVVKQEYSVLDLSARLADKGIRIMNLSDILCNIEDWARVLEANDDNENTPPITGSDRAYRRHLKIELVEEGGANEFLYTKIR